MQSLSRFLNLRRLGAAFAAAIGVAAGLVPIPLATAATVTLNGGTSPCTYSGSTVTAAGDFTFACTGGSSPGVLALNLNGTATSLAPSTTTSFLVTRTGGTTGDATGTLNVVGTGCTVNPTSVAFSNGTATSVTVTLTAAATAPESCVVNLTANVASLGSPNTTGTINIVDPNANVTFSFSSSTSTAFFNGSPVPITVTRTGGTAGAYDVPFSIGGTMTSAGNLLVGGGTLAPTTGKITFAAGSGASQTITYAPPATAPAGVTPPASLSVQLQNPIPVGTPPPGQVASLGTTTHVMSVQQAAGCQTTATHTVAWTGGQTYVSPVKAGETGAVSMIPTQTIIGADGYMAVVVGETSSTGDKADVHFTLSACPGDFTPAIGPCAQHTQYSGGTLRFSIGPKGPQVPWYLPMCELPSDTTTVYLNFRQIKRPTPTPPSAPGTPSCQFTTCPIYVQFN